MPEFRILALCGSLRAQSSNLALLLAAQTQAPSGIEVMLFESIAALPHFNPDLDGAERPAEDRPAPVLRFRRAVADAGALLISTPEYAHGIPGALKNALDWLVSSPEIIGKPVGLIYGSAGDASHAQEQLAEVLTTMSARLVREAVVAVSAVKTRVDLMGRVTDSGLVSQLRAALVALSQA